MTDFKNVMDRPDPAGSGLLALLGALGLGGTLFMAVVLTIASAVVPGHDWVADTISSLAAGRLEILADVALYGFAVALVAAGMAAACAHPGGTWWSVGAVSLSTLAAIVVMIAARNEYADGDQQGVNIHVELVYALGVLFLVAMLAMAPGAGRHRPRLKPIIRVLAALWAVLTPVFFFLPTGIDGLYERGLGLISGGFVACLSWTFLRRGLAARSAAAAANPRPRR